jgi:hypothetical protein
MDNNKLKLDANLPWDPTCWVGDGRSVRIGRLEQHSAEWHAAKKVNAAILRARRHDPV